MTKRYERDIFLLNIASNFEIDEEFIINRDVELGNIKISIPEPFVREKSILKFKSFETLEKEYFDYLEYINHLFNTSAINKSLFSELKLELFIKYATFNNYRRDYEENFRKYATHENKNALNIFVEKESMCFSQFQMKRNLRDNDEKLMDLAGKESDLRRKDLNLQEKSYQVLLTQIEEKETEIKSVDLNNSLVRRENYIKQKELMLKKIDGEIDYLEFGDELGRLKSEWKILGDMSDIESFSNFIELNQLKLRLNSLKYDRGEISKEELIKNRQAINSENKDYEDSITDSENSIFKERQKQIRKEINSRYSNGEIDASARDAQYEALDNLSYIDSKTSLKIAGITSDSKKGFGGK